MESMEKISYIIATNISTYRKLSSMTQVELADKLGYSDKSVSKWEQGNGIPDVYNLMRMAEIFGVTVNDLVTEHKEPVTAPKKKWLDFTNKNLIMILSVGVCWLIAVIVFVSLKFVFPEGEKLWLAFIYALPASAVVVLVLSAVWKYKTLIVPVSAVIWSLLLSIYLSFLPENYWMIFLIGIPLQILAILGFLLGFNILKNVTKKNK